MTQQDTIPEIPRLIIDEAALRARVVELAAAELGASDPAPYWTAVEVPSPFPRHWCGGFALRCLRAAGLTSWKWIVGKGFIWYGENGKPLALPRLPVVRHPKPGDVAYFKRGQHYAIVERVEGNTVHTIDGNTKAPPTDLTPCVRRHARPRLAAAAYYSIAPLLRDALKASGS
jgi:hypothetical protein